MDTFSFCLDHLPHLRASCSPPCLSCLPVCLCVLQLPATVQHVKLEPTGDSELALDGSVHVYLLVLLELQTPGTPLKAAGS